MKHQEIRKIRKNIRWLVYPVLFIKMLLYYQQVHMLGMMNVFHYIRVLLSGEDVPAYELVCVYEAPLITMLLLIGVYEIGAFGESRIRKGFFLAVYTLITVVMFADAAYCSYFGKCISVNQIFQLASLTRIASDGNVLSASLSPGCLFTLLDYPLMVWLYCKKTRALKKTGLTVAVHILLLLSGAVCWYYYSFNPSNLRDVQRVNHIEFFTSHTNDILVNVVGRLKHADVDEEELKERIDDLVRASGGETYRGVARGKNLILIQTESLNNFVVGKEYNGQELTPNLNKLLKKDTLYFDRFFSTTGVGNTCDAEFSVLNSLYPNNIRECYRMYVDNTYNGLPWLLREQGYDALAFHGYLKTFWNRNEAYKTQGFRKFYSQDQLSMTETSGFGLTDKELFRQSVNILKEEDRPFFAFMVTLTNHIPYELDESLATLELKEEDKDSLFGHYLQTVRYTDEAYGDLIACLKENNLYDNTMIVIYGDHQGLNLETASVERDMTGYLGRDYDYDEMLRVPLVIHMPGLGRQDAIHTVGGQVDLLPTIANLMGIEIPQPYIFGRDLLNTDEGFLAQISYVGVGSFISGDRDRIYIIGRDGTIEGGRMLSIANGEELPVDRDYCEEGSERAVSLIETCREVLDNNLISHYVTH